MSNEAQSTANEAAPKVSVIMPVLNAKPFLKDSVDSILCQSLSNFELLIVDNGSTDGSREYAESFRDSRIRILTEPTRGTAHAINAGIAASRADLLAVMDADDVSLRDRLLLQVEYLRLHAEVVLVGTRFSFLIGDALVPAAPPLTQHRDIRRALLDGAAVIAQGSTMFRACAARKVGGHTLNGPAHDIDFFLRMSEVGIVHNLAVTLYLYRLHKASSTTKTTGIITAHKRYAVACAEAREASQPEPSFEDFRRAGLFRATSDRLTDHLREMSARLYRNATIQRASGKRVSVGLGLMCSALLNPRVALWRVKREWPGVYRRFSGRAY